MGVQFLVETGAEVNLRQIEAPEGMRAPAYAEQQGRTEVAAYLRSKGAR